MPFTSLRKRGRSTDRLGRVQMRKLGTSLSFNAGVRSYRQGHPVVTRKVAGSSPAAPAILTSGPLAQQVEHQTFNLAVPSSSLGRLTINNVYNNLD